MLANIKDCTGCMACVNACPSDAIKIKNGSLFGHLYPFINQEKCTTCNKCTKICPALNDQDFNKIQKCYAAYSYNNIANKMSSSGGIAYELSKYILENKGLVFGAAFTNNCKIEHIMIDSLKDLEKLSGSKYAQSNASKCYKQIKHTLSNKKVLFIGTPCQVAGILNYIPAKLQKNLITIDLFCHGVPSNSLLNDIVADYHDIKNTKNVRFRDNRNHDKYTMSIVTNNNNKINLSDNDNFYIKCFLKAFDLRESCYYCKYSQSKRMGDISLGDFWGLAEDSKIKQKRKSGISAVLLNTKKGIDLFTNILEFIKYEERNIIECINGNECLQRPKKKNREIIKFQENWPKNKNLKVNYKKTFPIKYFLNKVLK